MANVSITSGGKERVNDATKLLSKAFEYDPVVTYMLCSMTTEQRLAYLPKYFNALLTAAALNNASFDEADDLKCWGVLLPPGSRVDNPWTLLPAGFIKMLWNIGFRGCQRMLSEFTPLADASKSKALAGQKKFYYVFFIATRHDARGKGLSSSMIQHWQKIASRDQLPIWLEATTAYSMGIYKNLGFEVIDEIVLGKAKVNADGMACKGGEGVKLWGMIWRPKLQTPE